MTLREIIITIIIGLAFWVFSFFVLYWVPLGYVGSILLSISGAIVVVWIVKKIRNAAGKELTTQAMSFSALVGCAVVLFAARMIAVSDKETITIDCSNLEAYQDPASVNRNGVVIWKVKDNLQKNFKITFKDKRAPFNESTGAYKKIVRGLGQSDPETAKNLGFFTYEFICSDGTIVDPMLFIPRP